MSKGKYSKKRGFSIRPIVLLLTVALLIGGTIGGTLAWLTATTQDVTNTFTVGDVAITLKESPIKWEVVDNVETGKFDYEQPKEGVNNTYKLIPGTTYKKDPVVEVNAESENCYLFVKATEINDPGRYLSYGYNTEGWTQLEQTAEEKDGKIIKSTVWYRVVNKTDSVKKFELLKDNKIIVNDTVVKADTDTTGTDKVAMPSADKAPNLVFTAYAVQTANLKVEQAWTEVNK